MHRPRHANPRTVRVHASTAMTDQPPRGRMPTATPPRAPAEAPIGWARQAFEFIAINRMMAFVTLISAFLLGMAGVCLTVAWQLGPQLLMQRAQYAHMTGRADGRIVESWLAVELDTATIRSPAYWRASAKASPCAVVEYQGDWTTPIRRAFCGNRLGFSSEYRLQEPLDMAPRVPFAWARDERGFIVPEIRIEPAAREWLATHPADTFMHTAWPAKSALDWLRLELDRPVEAAIAGWTAPPPVVPVAFDPRQPADSLPLGIVQTRLAIEPSWPALVAVGAMGFGLWFGGMALLLSLSDMAWPARVLLAILPLLSLPWWGDTFPRMLSGMNREWGSVVNDMFDDISRTDRLVVTEPERALLAGGERLAWRAGDGVYADTFGRFRFPAPPVTPVSEDAALAALADTVAVQARALAAPERVELLNRLRQDKLADLRAVGIIFLPAAKEALLDPQADPAVRRAAKAFLVEWVVAPAEVPYPRDLAYNERKRLFGQLGDLPMPEIAILAGGIAGNADPPRKP